VPVSIGISAGEPVNNHGELFGAAVLTAKSLSAEASADQILVSGVVRDLAQGKGFTFQDRGEVKLEDSDEPVRVFAVEGKEQASIPPQATSGPAPATLSSREVEVLRLVARGRTNQEIADELVIALNTVARHVSNIFDKTGVANRAEAASFAHVHDLA
jgi:DNA-binding NarL/FixJ family response regulator